MAFTTADHFHVTDQDTGFTCRDPDCTGRHSLADPPAEDDMSSETAMFIILNTALAVLALAGAVAILVWAWRELHD